MSTPDKPYVEAIDAAIGAAGSLTELAARLNISFQHIQQWKRVGRVPAEWVLKVEAAVEARVTRYDMRPDVFGERAVKAAA